jgi:nuclear pore complex protein Nup155
VEFLTLAVSNARSHAGSEYSRKESAVQFLTNVEEHLEVAQVQVEALTEVQALISRSGGLAAFDALVGESWGGLDRLENSLLTISEVGFPSPYLHSANQGSL